MTVVSWGITSIKSAEALIPRRIIQTPVLEAPWRNTQKQTCKLRLCYQRLKLAFSHKDKIAVLLRAKHSTTKHNRGEILVVYLYGATVEPKRRNANFQIVHCALALAHAHKRHAPKLFLQSCQTFERCARLQLLVVKPIFCQLPTSAGREYYVLVCTVAHIALARHENPLFNFTSAKMTVNIDLVGGV